MKKHWKSAFSGSLCVCVYAGVAFRDLFHRFQVDLNSKQPDMRLKCSSISLFLS